MNRRAALGFLGGAIIGGVTARASTAAATWCAPPGAQMWSALGMSGNVTLPSGLVVLDVDASVSSLTIPVGSTLVFHPDQTRTLTSSGNIIVDGTLDCSPTDPTIVHTVHFDCPPESGYVGGTFGEWMVVSPEITAGNETSWETYANAKWAVY